MTKIHRRDVLKTLAAGAGAAALAPSFAGSAFAQSGGKVVVGTWGGDYARLLTKNIEEPLLKPKGIEVVQDQASDAPRRAKMVAERRLPRGTVDIQGLSAANMFEMNEAGVVEQIDYSKLPNAKNLIPAMKYPYGVGHIYSGKVVIYNPKIITPGAQGLQGLARPEMGQQDRLHRHPVPVDHHRRLDGRDRWQEHERSGEGQGGADGGQEGRRPRLSDQRGLRPGDEERGGRHQRRSGRRASCSGRMPASRARPSRPSRASRPMSPASSFRRMRPTRTTPTPI